MATSRYDSNSGSTAALPRQNNTTTTTTGPSTINTSSTQNQSGTTSTSGTQNRQYGSTVQNMDPSSLAALQGLIRQLLGGGTQSQAQDRARRMQETQAVQSLRGDYSKGAAFSDAQGAMNQILRQAMEQAMPSLVRSAEGAGTSANSMRALLTQEALTRASEAASARGLQAATDYGTVGANYSSILERLTQPDNSVEEALLNALNIAKGAFTQTTGYDNQQTSQTGTTNTQTVGNQVQQNSGSTNTAVQQFEAPTAGASSMGGSRPSEGIASLTNAQWAALSQATRAPGTAHGSNWYQQYLI